MGSQIADIMAINGKEVIIKDISEEYLKKARENVENNLDSLLEFNVTRADKEIERIEKDASHFMAQKVSKIGNNANGINAVTATGIASVAHHIAINNNIARTNHAD